ncbi:hypothetical protein RISK_005487 [Rhodopirellula islandica]|uniref:Uncharacterized protein n=1 Tax=Rhodopirellula islandica TaxID=595434 RepID=A0A0J1B7I4_RHOIS|nr:hypothetical protein RISK_005487 [Rhodopirellula islandica]
MQAVDRSNDCKDWTIRGFLSSEDQAFRFSIRLFNNRTLEQ